MTVGTLVLFIVSVAASLISAALAERKAKKQPLDDTPAITAERGSWIPRVSGRRRVGAVIAKVWGRGSRREKQGKKRLMSSRPKTRIYLENAVHWIAVGPVSEMTEIEQGGKVIFSKRITPATHPSGTLVSIGSEGAFYIFWGEDNQPLNTRLGAADAMGITSRWPGICYIEWVQKRLSTTPRWPALTYVIKADLQETHLSRTAPTMPDLPDVDLDAAGSHIIFQAFNGAEGVGYFVLDGIWSETYGAVGETHRVQDAPWLSDHDIQVFSVTTSSSLLLFAGLFRLAFYTLVFPVGGVSGVNESVYNNTGLQTWGGSRAHLRRYLTTTSGGPNPGHYIAELMFSVAPHGLERDKNLFDLESFEVFAELMEDEGIHGSFIAQDGLDMQKLLGMVLQDLGCLMPINQQTGKIMLRAVRSPTVTPAHLSEDYLLDISETEITHGPRGVDKLVFNFVDAGNRFRRSTLGFGDDGQITRLKYERAREIQIVSTVHHDTAVKIVDRRSSEELSGGDGITIRAVRAARTLLPGDPLTVFGFSQRMRVLAAEPVEDTSSIVLTITTDFYAKPVSDFVALQGDPSNKSSGNEFVLPDVDFKIFEVPETLNIGAPPNVMCLRLRTSESDAFIHVSSDDITYDPEPLYDDSQHAGGFLAAEMHETDLYRPAIGPIFYETAFSGDLADVLDLTADVTGWLAGRQRVAIGDELFYLKKITSLGSGAWRLDGLIRARADTLRETHPLGAPLYIFQNDDGVGTEINPPITPGATLYMKSQPVAPGGSSVSLSLIVSRLKTLYGKGATPVPVSQISLDMSAHGQRLHFTTSGDLNIKWGYSTPRTQASGAGNFAAGTARLPVEPEGLFLVEILTIGDTLKRSDILTDPAYVYTSANRATDGLSSTSFKVRVTQQRDGLVSSTLTQILTKI